MNPHDQANLEFLLTSSKEVIREWYAKTTAVDHDYAMELLQWRSVEIDELSAQLAETCEREVEDLTLANQVLAKIFNK